MLRPIAMVILALVVAGCGGNPASSVRSGIQGTVMVGPSCPVQRINSPCPDRPIAATIVVRDDHGTEVARTRSGSDGHFKVDVAAGHYQVVGLEIGNRPLPRPIPTTVTVTPGTYVTAVVEYDSGIR